MRKENLHFRACSFLHKTRSTYLKEKNVRKNPMIRKRSAMGNVTHDKRGKRKERKLEERTSPNMWQGNSVGER